MRPPLPSRHSRLFGWWLAVLAVLALNLQGLQHYQPRMLLDGSYCSSRTDRTSSAPDGQSAPPGMDCGLCCAQPHNAAGPAGVPAAPTPHASIARVGLPVLAGAALAPTWSTGGPRGPPGRVRVSLPA